MENLVLEIVLSQVGTFGCSCRPRVFTLVPRVAGSLRFSVDVTCGVTVWVDVPSLGFLCFSAGPSGFGGRERAAPPRPLHRDRLLLSVRVFALFYGLYLSRLT